MHSPSMTIGVNVLSLAFCMALSTVAFSIEREFPDTPDVQQPEKAIHGTIVKVVERDTVTHTWEVSVESAETGEVVSLQLDKATARKVTGVDPVVGDKVVVKYDEHSKHALSFVAVAATSN